MLIITDLTYELNKVYRPNQHSLGHFKTMFTGLMTQPTVSKQLTSRQASV